MRRGKFVDFNDPIYLLDKNRGVCHIPTMGGDSLIIKSLKHKNRTAYDDNIAEFQIKNITFRVQLDELLEAIKYV